MKVGGVVAPVSGVSVFLSVVFRRGLRCGIRRDLRRRLRRGARHPRDGPLNGDEADRDGDGEP